VERGKRREEREEKMVERGEGRVERTSRRRLPPADVIAWCDRMLKNDCVGFIYREELQSLRSHIEAS
jgi:hypothetical protein